MGAIVPFIQDVVFDPQAIEAMSTALDDVCRALNIQNNEQAKAIVAMRIVELAKRGKISPIQLRDQLLAEANGKSETPITS